MEQIPCPVCKEPPKVVCKCPVSDATCANGHHWHTCQVHFVTVPRLGRHGFEGCSCPATNEIIEHYNERWKNVVEHEGVLDKESIMRELDDYDFLLENVPKVYDHVTSRISKPNTPAEAVIGEHDDRRREDIDEAVEEETKDLREDKDAEIEVLKRRIARVASVAKGRKAQVWNDLAKESDKLSGLLKQSGPHSCPRPDGFCSRCDTREGIQGVLDLIDHLRPTPKGDNNGK